MPKWNITYITSLLKTSLQYNYIIKVVNSHRNKTRENTQWTTIEKLTPRIAGGDRLRRIARFACAHLVHSCNAIFVHHVLEQVFYQQRRVWNGIFVEEHPVLGDLAASFHVVPDDRRASVLSWSVPDDLHRRREDVDGSGRCRSAGHSYRHKTSSPVYQQRNIIHFVISFYSVYSTFYIVSIIFTALHGMETRSSDEKAVRPSVRLSICLSDRLSVCQTRGLWQNGRKICPDFYTIRKII